MRLDQLFPFIGANPLERVHDGTLKAFVDHETGRGAANGNRHPEGSA
jgi:hypothetical protein